MGRVAPRMIPSIRLRRNYRDQWEIDQRRQQAIRLRLMFYIIVCIVYFF